MQGSCSAPLMSSMLSHLLGEDGFTLELQSCFGQRLWPCYLCRVCGKRLRSPQDYYKLMTVNGNFHGYDKKAFTYDSCKLKGLAILLSDVIRRCLFMGLLQSVSDSIFIGFCV
ncbi:hypothetical protein FKM82_019143 [Ascaphus truei]